MHSITDWLDRFCYKHPRLGIPNLMMYIVIGNIAVYLLDNFSGGACSAMLAFIRRYPSRPALAARHLYFRPRLRL